MVHINFLVNTLRFCRRVVCARREVLQLCAPKTVRCAKSYALHNLLPRFNIHAFCSSRLMVF